MARERMMERPAHSATTSPSSSSSHSMEKAKRSTPGFRLRGEMHAGDHRDGREAGRIGTARAHCLAEHDDPSSTSVLPSTCCTRRTVRCNVHTTPHHQPHPAHPPAELLAQQPRQHVHHPLHHVHAGGAQPRLVVERAEGRDEVRHVGDVHAQAPVAGAALDGRHVQRVVEVAGGGGVNGEDAVRPARVGGQEREADVRCDGVKRRCGATCTCVDVWCAGDNAMRAKCERWRDRGRRCRATCVGDGAWEQSTRGGGVDGEKRGCDASCARRAVCAMSGVPCVRARLAWRRPR